MAENNTNIRNNVNATCFIFVLETRVIKCLQYSCPTGLYVTQTGGDGQKLHHAVQGRGISVQCARGQR